MRPFNLFLAMVFLISTVALAHGGAEVSVYPTAAPPGGTLAVEGEDINPNGPIALFLNGLEGRFRLTEVQGDADGNFKLSLTLPEDVPPGSYVLKAIGSSGTSAGVGLTVTAAEPSAPEARAATAEEMVLRRARSAGEWAGLLALLGGAALLGTVLAWPRRGAER